jgi:hypothetical protein
MAVIVAYKVLEGASKKDLEAAVKEAIKQGWQPLGGVAISNEIFYQAMGGH